MKSDLKKNAPRVLTPQELDNAFVYHAVLPQYPNDVLVESAEKAKEKAIEAIKTQAGSIPQEELEAYLQIAENEKYLATYARPNLFKKMEIDPKIQRGSLLEGFVNYLVFGTVFSDKTPPEFITMSKGDVKGFVFEYLDLCDDGNGRNQYWIPSLKRQMIIVKGNSKKIDELEKLYEEWKIYRKKSA